MNKPGIIKPMVLTKHIFMAVYGDPGIGKTRFVGTSPGRVLIIRPPQEHMDSFLPSDHARAARGEIEEAVVKDWDDMDKLLDYLRIDGEEYDWVWIDNLSILQDVLLDDIWDTVVHEKPARARYGLDKGEYGINMDRISRWLRHIVGPDKFNFGFSAHGETAPSPDLDEEGDPIAKLMPWVQGKGMATKCSGYMNIVALMNKATVKGGKDKRAIRTDSSPNFYAKDQFDAFGGRVLDPSMPKVLELIEKSPGRKARDKATKRPAKRRVAKRR